MPRILLQIIVLFALCTPFVLIFQNNTQAFTPNEEEYLDELSFEIFSKEEFNKPFNGYKSITRGDFLRWIINNSEINITNFSGIKTPFQDISEQSKYYSYVSAGYVFGALSQFENDGKFLPNKKLTRLQAVKMLIALEGISVVQNYGNGMAEEWNDLPYNIKDKNIILVAIQKGFLENKTNGKKGMFIEPNARLSRSDALWMMFVYKHGEISSILENEVKNTPLRQTNTVENLLETQYWRTGEIETHQLEDSAIAGMVDSLNDPYSVYFPPEEAIKFEKYINEESLDKEEYAGLGVVVQEANEGGMVITQVFAGSPAEISDIRVGDVVIAVEGENVQELSVTEIAKKIKGPVGTSISLTIIRGEQTLEKRFIREKIFVEDLSSVTTEIIDGIVWITVRAFKNFTARDFEKALQQNITDTTRGVIVDLRYNPGGLMNAAQEMLGEVLPNGSIAVRLYSNSGEEVFYVEGSGGYTEIPLVVFQNGYSASASEIFSASIQDYERGEIIGTTSYGKGIAQTLFSLQRGSLKLTTAEFRSPLQNIIHGIGISPDIELRSEDDASYLYEAKRVFR